MSAHANKKHRRKITDQYHYNYYAQSDKRHRQKWINFLLQGLRQQYEDRENSRRKTCRHCGLSFTMPKRGPKQFCSHLCKKSYQISYQREADRRRRNTAQRVCRNCGKTFRKVQSRFGPRWFCSAACQQGRDKKLKKLCWEKLRNDPIRHMNLKLARREIDRARWRRHNRKRYETMAVLEKLIGKPRCRSLGIQPVNAARILAQVMER